MTEPWVAADVIAKPLGISKDSVYAWIARKEMPAHRVGQLWKSRVTEVDEWVRREDADDTAKPSREEGR